MRATSAVQTLSCDEAYLDVTGLGDPDQIARDLRSQIEAATGCPASAGIGPNPLLARLVRARRGALLVFSFAAFIGNWWKLSCRQAHQLPAAPPAPRAQATKRAKPRGQFRVTAAQALDFTADLAVGDLPGAGAHTPSHVHDTMVTAVRRRR